MIEQPQPPSAPPYLRYDPAVVGDRQAHLSEDDWRDLTNWRILPNTPEARDAVERAMAIFRLMKADPSRKLTPRQRDKAKQIANHLEKAGALINELAPALAHRSALFRTSLRPEASRVGEMSGWFYQRAEGKRGFPARGLLRTLVADLVDIHRHFTGKRLGGRDQNLFRFVRLVVLRADAPDQSFEDGTIGNALRSVVERNRR